MVVRLTWTTDTHNWSTWSQQWTNLTKDTIEKSKIVYLILSFSSAATTTGEKGNSKAALVPVSNLVSQLAIWLFSLLPAASYKHAEQKITKKSKTYLPKITCEEKHNWRKQWCKSLKGHSQECWHLAIRSNVYLSLSSLLARISSLSSIAVRRGLEKWPQLQL